MNPGTILERFEIIAELGRGTTGIVYESRSIKSERRCVIKVLQIPVGSDPRAAIEQFFDEGRTLAQLTGIGHPRIPTLHEVSSFRGYYYYVRKFIDGNSLHELARDGKLDMSMGLEIVADVAECIHWVHSKGFSHGNVSPSNVLVERGGSAHLIGFGRTRLVEGSEYLQPGFVGASPNIDLHDLQELLEWLAVSTGKSIPAKLQRIRKTCLVPGPEEFAKTIRKFLDRTP